MTTTTDLPAVEQPTSAPVATAAAPAPVLSILALVSALSGIAFGLIVPLSIVAIVLGILGLRQEPQARTMAIWSIVLGAVPFALGALAALVGLSLLVPFGIFAAFAL